MKYLTEFVLWIFNEGTKKQMKWAKEKFILSTQTNFLWTFDLCYSSLTLRVLDRAKSSGMLLSLSLSLSLCYSLDSIQWERQSRDPYPLWPKELTKRTCKAKCIFHLGFLILTLSFLLFHSLHFFLSLLISILFSLSHFHPLCLLYWQMQPD